MFTARVSPPRWAVVGGGLAGITGAGLLAGLLTARLAARVVDFAPALAVVIAVLVTFGLSFWAAPHLRRLARPGPHRGR